MYYVQASGSGRINSRNYSCWQLHLILVLLIGINALQKIALNIHCLRGIQKTYTFTIGVVHCTYAVLDGMMPYGLGGWVGGGACHC